MAGRLGQVPVDVQMVGNPEDHGQEHRKHENEVFDQFTSVRARPRGRGAPGRRSTR
jgi:hypothetical protein